LGVRNRIAELRKAQGLTLQALADRMGASNQQISHLEKGRRALTVDWVDRIADALDCHPFDLLDAPPQAKSERERALLELFRGMSDQQQDAFFQATAALAQPVIQEDDDKKKRA
jgi:transcriptional regulator with XRE-family HTH domain